MRTTSIVPLALGIAFCGAGIGRLLSDLTGTMIDFQVILTEDAFTKVERMELATSIESKIARPRDVRGQPRPALARIFHILDDFSGVRGRMWRDPHELRGSISLHLSIHEVELPRVAAKAKFRYRFRHVAARNQNVSTLLSS